LYLSSFSDFEKFCADNVSKHVDALNEEETIRLSGLSQKTTKR